MCACDHGFVVTTDVLHAWQKSAVPCLRLCNLQVLNLLEVTVRLGEY